MRQTLEVAVGIIADEKTAFDLALRHKEFIGGLRYKFAQGKITGRSVEQSDIREDIDLLDVLLAMTLEYNFNPTISLVRQRYPQRFGDQITQIANNKHNTCKIQESVRAVRTLAFQGWVLSEADKYNDFLTGLGFGCKAFADKPTYEQIAAYQKNLLDVPASLPKGEKVIAKILSLPDGLLICKSKYKKTIEIPMGDGSRGDFSIGQVVEIEPSESSININIIG